MPLRESKSGIAITVRLTPKSSRNAVDGLTELPDGRRAVKARVTAAPEKGKANAQLIKLIAKSVGIPASALSIQSGETSRVKTVGVSNREADVLARLRAWVLEISD